MSVPPFLDRKGCLAAGIALLVLVLGLAGAAAYGTWLLLSPWI